MTRLPSRRAASGLLGALLLLAPVLRAGDPLLATELVVEGIHFGTGLASIPGDDRIFVLEQHSGRIELIKDGVIQPTPFLGLFGQVQSGGERGLLGMAFHPDYATNGRFYVAHNDLTGAVVLRRFLVDPMNEDVGLLASGETLLTVPKPFIQHNGGTLAFGPDGLLYMSLGDGGSANDPFDNAQDLGSLLGKILRLDVDSAFPYAIPADNPFVGVAGAREEIFAYGFRNPWRFSIDPTDGALLIGDVGQELREEIDYIAPATMGQNFGWRCAEGSLCTNLGTCLCPEPAIEAPIHEYDHDDGCAVIGGHVYRGSAIPELEGHYLFGDYCTGKVWSFELQNGAAVNLVDRTTELNPPGGALGFISSFGVDGDGELLILGYQGKLWRVVSGEPEPDCDEDGIPDEDEILLGTAFDVNLNDVPDACELLLAGSAFVQGQPASMDFVGGDPFMPVAWFVSARGIGPGPCYFTPPLCLDLLPFDYGSGFPEVPLLLLAGTDAQGASSLQFVVPTGNLGTDKVAIQILTISDGQKVKSNPIQRTIQP